MRINHNLNAINSHRLMNDALSESKKSAEKLSSGLRINKASDDAAGLSISEKMRAQIRGLDQVSRNIQDGISLIQTAEGGLSEVHSLLQRGRELSVQVANDTLTENDKQVVQKEVDQINSEINRIANNTEFNTIRLLNQKKVTSSYNVIINGLKSGWLEVSENLISSKYGLQGQGGNLNIILDPGAPYGTLAYVGGFAGNLELHIDMSDFTPGSLPNGINNLGKGYYDDRIIAHEMVHAVMDEDFGVTKINEIHAGNGVWFLEGSAEFIQGADERLKQVIGTTGVLDNTKVDSLIDRATDLLNGAVWTGDNQDYSAAYVIMKYMDSKVTAAGNTMADVMDYIDTSIGTGINALQSAIAANTTSGSYANFISDFSQVGVGGGNDYVLNHITLNWGGDEDDTGSISGSDNGGPALNAEAVIDEATATDTLDGQPLDNFNVIWPSVGETTEPLKFQIGANTGMEIKIDLIDVTTGSIGTKDVDVVSKAPDAIDKFDNAINIVSYNRSILGSLQNRLEHAKYVVDINYENTSASESRIRDTDIAKEMTKYTKGNILSQAAQAMLAQSNQKPQAILELLR